ncbi:MAG: lactate utilization protein [Clostridia bacterium]|nr:lactate utilization protein [Clostridia bacterium]
MTQISVEKTLKALKENRMTATLAKTKAEVCQIVRDMLFDGAVLTAGGSMSLRESGVWELLYSPAYRFYDRSRPGMTPEEQLEAFRMAIGCDFFFCSANAITENGELINVDGKGNRVSSICFGPKRVVVVAGINKIVPDVQEGLLRVKKIAAPLNSKRLHTETPCEKLGQCASLCQNECPDETAGCRSENRICCQYLISGFQREPDRIRVILCEEPLGY